MALWFTKGHNSSPNNDLMGQRVRLQWRDTSENQTFLNLVRRGIEFDEAASANWYWELSPQEST